MEIKSPASFPYDSKREEADEQMRRRFRDLGNISATPILHGVSAFGTRLSFYEYDSTTHVLRPAKIQRSRSSITADVAPMTCWDCDVLQPEGANRLTDVVNKVKEMCSCLRVQVFMPSLSSLAEIPFQVSTARGTKIGLWLPRIRRGSFHLLWGQSAVR